MVSPKHLEWEDGWKGGLVRVKEMVEEEKKNLEENDNFLNFV